MADYGLGRIHVEDERDRNYPMSLRLATLPAPLARSKMWRSGAAKLDQGQTPHCVGFTGANWMQNTPVRDKVANQTGHDLYAACKAIDGHPNEDGSYGRALLKVLQDQGRVGRYLWARSVTDVQQWLLTTGPVLIGIPWFESMFDPDVYGRLHISGSVAGGHEVLLRGYDRKYLRVVNSWGRTWGLQGEAWLSLADLDRLLQDGDAGGVEEIILK